MHPQRTDRAFREQRNERICEAAREGHSIKWIAATFGLDGRTVERIVGDIPRSHGWGNEDEPPAEWEIRPDAWTALAELPTVANDWLDALEDFPPNTSGTCVYFIQEIGTRFVKIGVTEGRYPWRRLMTLQIGNPHELAVTRTVKGSVEVEAVIHQAFRHLRVRGEWFEADDYLAEIARLR